MTDPEQPTSEQVQQVYEFCLQQYGERRDVTGIDIGRRQVNNQPTDEKVVRIHLRPTKSGVDQAPPVDIPDEMAGVKIEIIAADYGPEASQ